MEKRSTVKSIQSNGDFVFNEKQFYKYEIQMENGDVGEYNSLSAKQDKFVEGVDVDYIYDVSNSRFPKIKPVYNFNASPSRDGNFKNVQKAAAGDNTQNQSHGNNIQLMIVKQSSLKVAAELAIAKNKTDLSSIFKTANTIVEWVMKTENAQNAAPAEVGKDLEKQTTDLPF